MWKTPHSKSYPYYFCSCFQPTTKPSFLRPHFCNRWLTFQPAAEPDFFRPRSCLCDDTSRLQLNPVSFDHVPAFAVDTPSIVNYLITIHIDSSYLMTSHVKFIYHGLPNKQLHRFQPRCWFTSSWYQLSTPQLCNICDSTLNSSFMYNFLNKCLLFLILSMFMSFV